MQGLTDAPMRAVLGEMGAFTFAVSEFLRISTSLPSKRAFYRHVPELLNDGRTPSGLPVQVQLLGGDAALMADSATVASQAGAKAIDLNFGCPAPIVNNHDGGAILLKDPSRIRSIVRAVRNAVPAEIPVSAKLRLGWDSMDSIIENAECAAEGGASWLTIHGRTRAQGYAPPAHWEPIGLVRERTGIPVVANGDIWSVDDFRRCRDVTGCTHFMLGRGALANPYLSMLIAQELRLLPLTAIEPMSSDFDWTPCLRRLAYHSFEMHAHSPSSTLARIKQWLMLASRHGAFLGFDQIKRLDTLDDLFDALAVDRSVATVTYR
ncbi:MAG: tRNA-dihydrouridine synthase family protein [Capsulimonadaceae bacterium]|nr:tRNA-dihydrouridine synthase family protein [Capsulimonadaceae bacterium]